MVYEIKKVQAIRQLLVDGGASPDQLKDYDKLLLMDKLNPRVMSQIAFYGIAQSTLEQQINGELFVQSSDRRSQLPEKSFQKNRGPDRRYKEEIKVEPDMLSAGELDIVEFKWYNDEFGERVGDVLLATVGGILAKNLRPYDCNGNPFEYIQAEQSPGNGVASRDKGDEFRTLIIGTLQHREVLDRILAHVQLRAIPQAVERIQAENLTDIFKDGSYQANLERLSAAQAYKPIILTAGYVSLDKVLAEASVVQARNSEYLTARMISLSTDVLQGAKSGGGKGKVNSYDDLLEGRISPNPKESISHGLVEGVRRSGGIVLTKKHLSDLERDHFDIFKFLMTLNKL
jgi:GGDEF domain-containing protein